MVKITQLFLEKLGESVRKNHKKVLTGVTALCLAAGIANADSGLYISALTNLNDPEVLCEHKTGKNEGYDSSNGGDLAYMNPPQSEKIHFYSKNDLTNPPTEGVLYRDVRDIDSLSTFSNYFEGERINEPNVPANISFQNYWNPETNNSIASFYKNEGTTADPNWVYTGTTLDAKVAGDAPYAGTTVHTVNVEEGLSDIMQVKYFYPEDVNFDGKTNMQDYAALAANWQRDFAAEGIWPRTPYSPMDNPELYSDIDNDGYVGMNDLALLSTYWMDEKPPYAIDAYDPID